MTTNYIAQLKENMHLEGADLWLELAETAEQFYLSRKLLENQKEVDWNAFYKLELVLSKLKGQQP